MGKARYEEHGCGCGSSLLLGFFISVFVVPAFMFGFSESGAQLWPLYVIIFAPGLTLISSLFIWDISKLISWAFWEFGS